MDWLDMWFLVLGENGNRELVSGHHVGWCIKNMFRPHIFDVTEFDKIEELEIREVSGGFRIHRQNGEFLFGVCL